MKMTAGVAEVVTGPGPGVEAIVTLGEFASRDEFILGVVHADYTQLVAAHTS